MPKIADSISTRTISDVIGSRFDANIHRVFAHRVGDMHPLSSATSVVRPAEIRVFYVGQTGPKTLLNHVLFISIPNFRNSFQHWKYNVYMGLKEKYRKLRNEVSREIPSTDRTEIRQEMYARDPDLVIQTEWTRMKSQPMFSPLLNSMWFEPTVFHASFSVVAISWILTFCFIDLSTKEFKSLKRDVTAYDGDDLRPYLCCQKVIEQTHVYVFLCCNALVDVCLSYRVHKKASNALLRSEHGKEYYFVPWLLSNMLHCFTNKIVMERDKFLCMAYGFIMRKALEKMDRVTNHFPKEKERRTHDKINPEERGQRSSLWRSMNFVDATTHCAPFMIESGITIGTIEFFLPPNRCFNSP